MYGINWVSLWFEMMTSETSLVQTPSTTKLNSLLSYSASAVLPSAEKLEVFEQAPLTTSYYQ